MSHLRLRWHTGLALVLAAGTLILLWRRETLGGVGDVTVFTPTAFSSLDGSPQDSDGVRDGILTVQGDLTIANGGSITCDDDLPLPPNGDACAIQINVTGKLTIEAGGAIYAENRRSGGDGGAITINVGGDLLMESPANGATGAVISTSKISGAGDTGSAGNVTIHVTGDVSVEPRAKILADAHGEAGSIEITGRLLSLDGLISATGVTAIGRGGPIKIVASTYLTISDESVVTSRGQGPGADLVHLEGCTVTIYGLVESSGPGHQGAAGKNLCNDPPRPGHPENSTACIEIWSGTTLTIDSNAPHNGEVNADTALSGGTQGRGWIELFANGDISILGGSSGHFAVHANQPNLTDGHGGQILVISQMASISGGGLAFEADATPAGGDGGQITLHSASGTHLGTIYARGDFNPTGGFGKGGTIVVRAGFGDFLTWGGTGDVRPTGAGIIPNPDPSADPQRGNITLTGCLPFYPYFISALQVPSLGTPTTPHGGQGETHCSFPPFLPDYVHLPEPTCSGGQISPPPTATPNSGCDFKPQPIQTPTPDFRGFVTPKRHC